MSGGKSLYHQLLAKGGSSSSSSSSSGGGTFRGGSRRFSGGGSPSSKKKSGRDSQERVPPVPTVKDGRVARLDDDDRELAYRPPAPPAERAVSWQAPTFWEIMADLGLRVVEVGIASIASEIAYFFTRRRFMPRHLRRG